MFIARWIVDVKFGHKDEFIALQKKWMEDIGNKTGMDKITQRMLNGSIGAAESRFEMETEVGSLAELEQFFAKLPEIPSHKEWGKQLEPLVVSGSNRWEIMRVIKI
jgi:hypothetical protein